MKSLTKIGFGTERETLVHWLLETEGPLTAAEVAKRANLDRIQAGDALCTLSGDGITYRDSQGKWNLYASSPNA